MQIVGRQVVVGQTATVGWVASLLEAVANGENHVLCWVQMQAGYRRTPISSQQVKMSDWICHTQFATVTGASRIMICNRST